MPAVRSNRESEQWHVPGCGGTGSSRPGLARFSHPQGALQSAGRNMNKVVMSVGLVAVAAGTTWTGVTWWSAARTEASFREYAAQVSSDPAMPFDMSVASYERGVLRSHAVSRIAVRGSRRLAFELEHAIDHGPDLEFGLSRVTTTVRWPEAARPAIAYYFEGRQPLSLVTVVGLDGHFHTEVVSPAFEKSPQDQSSGKVIWGGLKGSIGRPATGRLRGTVSMPRLALDTPAGSGHLDGLAVHVDWKTAGPNSLYWTGASSLSIVEAGVVSPFGSYAVRDVAFGGYQKDQGKTLLAGYTVRAASGEMMNGEQRQPVFRNANLDLELSGLDRKALSDLFEGTSKLPPDLPLAERNEKSMALVARALEAIAAQSPSLALKQLEVETPHGMFSATGGLDLSSVVMGTDPKSPKAWVERLEGSFTVEVSPGLARLALAKQSMPKAYSALSKPGERVDPEAHKALADHFADRRLKQLTEHGALRTKGGKYVVEIDLKRGEWLLNGLTREQFMVALAEQDAGAVPGIAAGPRPPR